MSKISIAMPPLEWRKIVGPTDPEKFDNPTGTPIYADFGIAADAYETVFDFGCGCGRLARKLLQQTPRPRRYVGIDVHRGMIDWCRENLSTVDPNFQFFHHDVYSPTAAPGNSLRLGLPFPAQDGEFSLVIAHSIFTHLLGRQADYYLGEVARILAPRGIAFTSWFLFDNQSFPFFEEGPFSLYAGEVDPTHAVVYDRAWLLDTLRVLGLGVRRTATPEIAGHQWSVWLERRSPATVDQFPLGEESAEWLCGATLRPRADPLLKAEMAAKEKIVCLDSKANLERFRPPALFGALAELDTSKRKVSSALVEIANLKSALSATQGSLKAAHAEMEELRRSLCATQNMVKATLDEVGAMKRSRAWRIGRAATSPVRAFKRAFLT